MNKTEYLNKRNEMLRNAQSMIDAGDIGGADKLMENVKELDEKFSNEARSRANMESLKNNAPLPNLEKGSEGFVNGDVLGQTGEVKTNEADEKLLVNAWAKFMMNKPMTDDENSAFVLANSAMTTENSGILVPETVAKGIWKEIGEQYPLYNDVLATNIKGTVTVLKSKNSTDASWYEEFEETEDGNEMFDKNSLHGCELSRCVTISWKLREMAIEDFIPFIQSQLAEKMGAAAAYGVFKGSGPAAANSGKKDEPRGIKTALMADEKKEQVITVSGEATYKDISSMVGKVKGTYKKGAKWYAKGEYIWDTLSNITDKTGKPIFIPDPVNGGVGRMFGFAVEEDDSVDTLLFGNANKGYHLNVNKTMTIETEDHKKKRETDYIAYAIMDGDVRTLKAFSYLDHQEKTDAE